MLLGFMVTVTGCGIFGVGGPSVKIETVASGFRSVGLPESTTVLVRPGTVVLESTVNYGQPGWVIDAGATAEMGTLTVDVETKQTDDAVVVDFWFARYRLTVTDLDPGAYRLRLFWHNRHYPPVLQFRDLVDTTITVP